MLHHAKHMTKPYTNQLRPLFIAIPRPGFQSDKRLVLAPVSQSTKAIAVAFGFLMSKADCSQSCRWPSYLDPGYLLANPFHRARYDVYPIRLNRVQDA